VRTEVFERTLDVCSRRPNAGTDRAGWAASEAGTRSERSAAPCERPSKGEGGVFCEDIQCVVAPCERRHTDRAGWDSAEPGQAQRRGRSSTGHRTYRRAVRHKSSGTAFDPPQVVTRQGERMGEPHAANADARMHRLGRSEAGSEASTDASNCDRIRTRLALADVTLNTEDWIEDRGLLRGSLGLGRLVFQMATSSKNVLTRRHEYPPAFTEVRWSGSSPCIYTAYPTSV
jgi:hypothetical protein